MKLQYLGTAAAEGIPALFCNCPVCKKSREAGGRNYRSRAQALVNDDLLLDFGPDTYWHVCRFGLDLTKVRACLITHGHEDHFLPSDIAFREHGYAYLRGDFDDDDAGAPPLEVYLSAETLNHPNYQNYVEKLRTDAAFALHPVRAFEPFSVGGYTVTALTAHHAPGFGALIYIISDGKSTLLYAHDTGLFPEDTMAYLEKNRPRFDFVSFDCTGAIHQCGQRHMNLRDNIEMRRRLEALGCVDEKTVCCCNHFSHNGRATYDEFVPIAEKAGFLVSFDGMQTEF